MKKLPLTLIRVSKEVRYIVHIHHIGHQGLGCSKGCRHRTNYTSAPPTNSSCHFLLPLSFTLHKSLFCWQLIYHQPDLLHDPSSVSPVTKLLRDKPQDYSSWLLFPDDFRPSLHLILNNGHYTTTILSVTKKRHLSESETDLTCMHSYIEKDCKQCRLSSRYE